MLATTHCHQHIKDLGQSRLVFRLISIEGNRRAKERWMGLEKCKFPYATVTMKLRNNSGK